MGRPRGVVGQEGLSRVGGRLVGGRRASGLSGSAGVVRRLVEIEELQYQTTRGGLTIGRCELRQHGRVDWPPLVPRGPFLLLS